MKQTVGRRVAIRRGTVLALVALLLAWHGSAWAYGVSQTGSAKVHNFIMGKAIKYLKQTQSTAAKWPLDTFLPWLVYGSWFADNTGLKCSWDYVFSSKSFRCDTIHHYGEVGPVKSFFGVVVAHTGDFAAPQYAQALFEQALKFWPGGSAPSLAALPSKWAGKTSIPGRSSKSLLNTYLGGFPQCELWARGELQGQFLAQGHSAVTAFVLATKELSNNHQDYCPKWPLWAAKSHLIATPLAKRGMVANETRANAIRYLGWALHLLQDISVPGNAVNFGTSDSEDFEDEMEQMVADSSFAHLPVIERADGSQSYKYSSKSVYFPPALSRMNDLAVEMRETAKKVSRIFVLPMAYARQSDPATKERIMDAAIKLTAAGIERYLEQLMAQLEPFAAASLTATTPCGSFSTIYSTEVTVTLPASFKYCFELTHAERGQLCDQQAYVCSTQACINEFTPCSWHPKKTIASRRMTCTDYKQLVCGNCECLVNAVFQEKRASFIPGNCSRHDYYVSHQASCDGLADKFPKAVSQEWIKAEADDPSLTADGGRP